MLWLHKVKYVTNPCKPKQAPASNTYLAQIPRPKTKARTSSWSPQQAEQPHRKIPMKYPSSLTQPVTLTQDTCQHQTSVGKRSMYPSTLPDRVSLQTGMRFPFLSKNSTSDNVTSSPPLLSTVSSKFSSPSSLSTHISGPGFTKAIHVLFRASKVGSFLF